MWVQPVEQSEAAFSIKRDSIYFAIILWGLGGSVLMVLSLSMISILTGEYTVSRCIDVSHCCMIITSPVAVYFLAVIR